MILQDFLVQDRGGYYCRYGDFHLDPKDPVQNAVISHGHGDHATPGHGQAFLTAPTRHFMELRFARMHLPRFQEIAFHQSFRLGEVELRFIPAGHILGSAQILMEHQGVQYLYTGDYKLQADPTCEPFEAVAADVLITETTFADPDVRHPAAEQEILKLNEVQSHIMLGTYSLGKAQRLTALIHTHCPDKKILVHHGILPIHRIYQHFGVELGDFEIYNRKAMKNPGPPHHVYLMPPMTFRSYIRAKNVVRAFASGWSHLQQNNQLALYISDHVDWQDILEVISQVKPQEIWTIHGEGKHLRQHLGEQLPVRTL